MKKQDYNELERTCKENSGMITTFVDEFLIDFCAEKEGLDKQFARQISKYAKLLMGMPEESPGMLADLRPSYLL